jgi:hypothetical protein
VSHTRNQGCARYRDLEKGNAKGLEVEERLQDFHPLGLQELHKDPLGRERVLLVRVVGVGRWKDDRHQWRLVHVVSSCRGGSERRGGVRGWGLGMGAKGLALWMKQKQESGWAG